MNRYTALDTIDALSEIIDQINKLIEGPCLDAVEVPRTTLVEWRWVLKELKYELREDVNYEPSKASGKKKAASVLTPLENVAQAVIDALVGAPARRAGIDTIDSNPSDVFASPTLDTVKFCMTRHNDKPRGSKVTYEVTVREVDTNE